MLLRTPSAPLFLAPFALASLAAAAAAAGCGNGASAERAPAAADRSPAAGDAKKAAPAPAPGPASGPPRPSAKDENRVFDLLDNRLLAHIQRQGGLVVLPGSGAFAKYVHFAKPKLSWQLKQSADGKRVGVADKYASLEVPLTAEQAAAGTMTLRVKSEGSRLLEIKPNGAKATALTLADGWSTVTTPVAGLRAGENRVQLVTGGKGDNLRVEWIQFGGAAPAAGAPGADDAPAWWDAKAKALVLPEGSGLAYYTFVPAGGKLVGEVRGAGCKLTVRATPHDGKPVETVLSGRGSADLSAVAGKMVRLDLVGAGCARAELADAAFLGAGPAVTVKKPRKPKYVVLWVMDSLRADRTRPFNPKARAESPNFEALAKRGAVFMRNYVQGNESKASHASIWSGAWVSSHRYIPGGKKGLDASFVTIDELGKAAGMFLSGVSGNGYLTKKNGFGSWDAYRNHIHDGGGLRGEDIYGKAIESVAKRHDKPFMLYLGTIDTHVSWRAKEPWMSKYDPEPYSGKYVKEASGIDIEKMATSGKAPSERDIKRIRAIYDSNVSYQDELIGRLIAKLEEWKILDDTMIIITADHGDEQWESGRVGHGGSLRESLVHVPLVIIAPGLIPPGLVDEGTDTVDIVPTVADALGLAVPDTAQGESLIPLAQGVGRGYLRCSLASQYENAWAMRCGDFKARVANSGTPMVYDLAADYYEKTDLAESRFIERRFLADALSTFLVYQKGWKKSLWGSANNMKGKAAEDLE